VRRRGGRELPSAGRPGSGALNLREQAPQLVGARQLGNALDRYAGFFGE
jgi:hypothetical protein